MTKCAFCEKLIDEMPWVCKRCGKVFCGDHRLPESHNCKGMAKGNIFRKISKGDYKIPRKEKFKSNNYTEQYTRRKSHRHSKSFSFKGFLRSYISPRIQKDVKPYILRFLPALLIGLVLNYVYYHTFSLSYLFIGGVNDWFSILMPTLNYGVFLGYDIFYLIINGLYYFYFYSSFVMLIYHTIKNLNRKDTWIMLIWFLIIIFVLIKIFPVLI